MKRFIECRKHRQFRSLVVLVACALVMPFGSMAMANSMTVTEIIFSDEGGADPSVLAGTVDMTFNSGTNMLWIDLANTSTAPTGGDSVTNFLSGLGFSLPDGVGIVSGSANMAGEIGINLPFAPPAGDVSGEWGFANAVSTGPFANVAVSSVNTTVSTMASSSDSLFGPWLFPPPSLNGPSMGLLSGSVPTSTAGGLMAIQDSIHVELQLSGYAFGTPNQLLNFISANDVVLSFGSPTVSTVPEPSTITLFGTGALLLFGYVWRRQKQQATA